MKKQGMWEEAINHDMRCVLRTSVGLVEVHVNPFQLKVGLSSVAAAGIHSVLIAYNLRGHKCSEALMDCPQKTESATAKIMSV